MVYEVFEYGVSSRVPLHVEANDKEEEYLLGDVVGVGAKIREWRRFNEVGGPFRRFEDEDILKWRDRVYVDLYEWPDVTTVIEEATSRFEAEVRKYIHDRFIVCKILGPTETAEAFFSPPQSKRAKELGQIAHRFDFSLFLKLNYKEAVRIYDRISYYILELVKSCSELDFVDAVRIADDVCWYRGPLYPPQFVKEKYVTVHRMLANSIKRRGKYAIIHTDGDITRDNLAMELASTYDALHPLDLCPKSTVEAAYKWINRIVSLRKMLTSMNLKVVFFTGLPIDIVFNDSVLVSEVVNLVRYLLELHGRQNIVIATTHRPYPGRSYKEELPRRKILAVREFLLKFRV